MNTFLILAGLFVIWVGLGFIAHNIMDHFEPWFYENDSENSMLFMTYSFAPAVFILSLVYVLQYFLKNKNGKKYLLIKNWFKK